MIFRSLSNIFFHSTRPPNNYHRPTIITSVSSLRISVIFRNDSVIASLDSLLPSFTYASPLPKNYDAYPGSPELRPNEPCSDSATNPPLFPFELMFLRNKLIIIILLPTLPITHTVRQRHPPFN